MYNNKITIKTYGIQPTVLKEKRSLEYVYQNEKKNLMGEEDQNKLIRVKILIKIKITL